MPIISNSVQNNSRESNSVSPRSRSYRSGGTTVQLQEGQTLKGVVSDVHGKEITLSMEDGTSFTGKLPDANQYSIGQKAAFQITSLDNNTIYMKALNNAYLLDMEDTIEQALEEANMPKTPRNLDVVRSLLQNQQSISRQNILDSIRLCAKFPEADVNSVITMNRLGMPLTQENVRQFESYQNNTHQLLYQMDSLTDSISDMLTSIGKQVPRLSKEVGTQLLNLALEGNPTLEEGNLNGSSSPLLSTFTGKDGQPMALNGQGSPVPVPLDGHGTPIPVTLDANGNVVPAAVDANGNAVPASLDANGNILPGILDPKGEANGNPAGNVNANTAGDMGANAAEGAAVSAAENTSASTAGNANANATGNTAASMTGPNFVIPAAVDANGNIIPAAVDANGNVIPSAVDAHGNMIPAMLDTDGNIIPTTVDANGNIVPEDGAVPAAVDADGNIVPAKHTDGNAAFPPINRNSTMTGNENALLSQETGQQTDNTGAGPFSKMRQLLSSFTDSASGKGASTGETEAQNRPVFLREQAGAILTPETRSQFSRLLADYPIPEDIRQGIQNGTATARQLLTAFQKAFPDMTEEQAGKLLSSKPFHALVKQQFLSNWTLSPERLKQDNAMDELYSRMSRQFQTLSQFSENVLGRDVFTRLSGTAAGMEENLDFMKSLNQTFQYVQLPLKLQNQNAHGDLYVMTRKEALKKDPRHLKALLHLDMEHLGTLDIHISRENSAVSTKFFVSSKETKNLLERNMDMLKNAINAQGFSFSSELSTKEKEVDIVNDFIAAEAPVGDMKRYNFDLRA